MSQIKLQSPLNSRGGKLVLPLLKGIAKPTGKGCGYIEVEINEVSVVIYHIC